MLEYAKFLLDIDTNKTNMFKFAKMIIKFR
jgi:hypothetical protein